jgi:uncharacterized membrane protein YgcG
MRTCQLAAEQALIIGGNGPLDVKMCVFSCFTLLGADHCGQHGTLIIASPCVILHLCHLALEPKSLQTLYQIGVDPPVLVASKFDTLVRGCTFYLGDPSSIRNFHTRSPCTTSSYCYLVDNYLSVFEAEFPREDRPLLDMVLSLVDRPEDLPAANELLVAQNSSGGGGVGGGSRGRGGDGGGGSAPPSRGGSQASLAAQAAANSRSSVKQQSGTPVGGVPTALLTATQLALKQGSSP